MTRKPDLLALASLKPAPANARRHDLGAIIESMRANGYVDDIVIDSRTGCILGGHGRADALKAMLKAGEKPPVGVTVKAGEWFVPVNRRVRSRNDAHAMRIVVALNRTADRAENDEALLAQMLVKLAEEGELKGSGYDGDELDALLRDLGKQDDDDADQVPETPKNPVTNPGDLWTLGDHLLLCGDSTKPEDLARVMGKDRAILLATDPPYGVAYEGGAGNKKKRSAIPGDESTAIMGAFIRAALPVLEKSAPLYCWFAGGLGEPLYRACREAGYTIRAMIVWSKLDAHFGAYMAQYKQAHEPCLYAVRATPPAWYGPTDARTVWAVKQPTRNELHPTQKPVELWDIPIRNHTKPGGILFEPFSGSGTQIIAAEKAERRCRAIEIAPAYVDVAVERWQAFTGRKATRVKA